MEVTCSPNRKKGDNTKSVLTAGDRNWWSKLMLFGIHIKFATFKNFMNFIGT